ncbi:MAG: MgtC/SapB family protein [Sciscionella sp.]|nr:MgtC/SapB family protein [Sciscionella sp.]
MSAFMQPSGQGLAQIGDLLVALVLSSLIGLERELKQKSAGLRTLALVGLGAALFMLVSKYGFGEILRPGHVVLDPSRVAAQIVTGIGFIGGGLIFVRRDVVRGLTTAAVVWVTAAVGSACGAGLPVLATVIVAGHFVVLYGFPPLLRLLTRSRQVSESIRLRYTDGMGVLRQVLATSTGAGFSVAEVHAERHAEQDESSYQPRGGRRTARVEPTPSLIDLRLRITGAGSVHELAASLSELSGVHAVDVGDVDDTSE